MNFLTSDVKIVVDDKGLPAQLARVKRAVTRTVSAIKTTFSRMVTSFKAAFDKMVKYAKWGALAIAGALTLATRAAMKQQDAQFLLAAALKISGEWTLALQHRFEAFAASVQQATIYGDEEVLALMQLQKSLGVTSDKLEEAAKMAIGLATATGRDVRSMSMYIALAQQGEFTMLRRYIPALRSTTDATEQLRIITEFAAAGFKLAEERSKTASGALRQMWNALGDVAEVIGGALLPVLTRTFKRIKEWAEDNQKRIKEWAELWVEKIGMVMNKLWDLIDLLTEDFSKGMRVVKEELIIFFTALVDTFLIAGIAAGKAFWRGIGFGGVDASEIMIQYEKLGGVASESFIHGWEKVRMPVTSVDPFPDTERRAMYVAPERWKQAERQATINLLKKEVGVVEQLKATWEGVGKAMSEAIPSRVSERIPEIPAEYGMLPFGKGAETVFSAPAVEEAEETVTTQEKLNELTIDRIDLIEQETQGWAALNIRLTSYASRVGNWGKQLGRVLERAFDGIADHFATMLMRQKVDWKAFAAMFIHELLAMIIKLQMAVVLKAALGYAEGSMPTGPVFQQSPATTPGLQHGGEVVKTGLAVVHKGEKFSGVPPTQNGSRGEPVKFTINVNNESPERIQVSPEESYMYSDQRIIDVSIKAMDTHGPFRRSLRQARRF